MEQVTIYTWPTCPFCARAKALLDEKKISYKEIDVSDPEKLEKLREETKHRSVPQIFIGKTFIGGSDDLYGKEMSGELDKLLKKG